MDPRPVGMFDSGAGGLSIVEAFRAIAPAERVLYFADTDWFPYGPRPAAEVRKRSFAITQRLLHGGAKLIVVACNTASAAAIADLRAAFDVPFVGMVPGVKPATLRSKTGRVVILATSGTLDGDLYARVRDEFGAATKVRAVHHDDLAGIVERGETGTETSRAAIREAIAADVRAGADTVVLGCTHFHFLAADIEHEFPGIALIDTSEAVARRAASVLAELDLEAPPGSRGGLDLIVSGDRDRFAAVMDHLGFAQALEVAT